MKWFKHMCDASEDEFIAMLEARFGWEGYGRWFKLLEIVGKHMDKSSKCSVVYSWADWQRFLKGKRNKLETFLVCLENESKINLKRTENVLEIEIPKLLKIRDEYSKKSGQTPDECPDNVPPKKKEERRKKEDIKTNPSVEQIRPDPDQVGEIFEHWRKTMNHPRARLDEKRRKVIRRALKDGYSVEDLKKAVTGCAQTPHNMGKNERGQRYDGLELILRNGDQIDRFMANATTDNSCSGGAI